MKFSNLINGSKVYILIVGVKYIKLFIEHLPYYFIR